ncbi:PEGA domain-containing protein [Polyangium aurulentum]|uniref:PEGA domain-containing protein n=1 Tax=Polyangium aurulentum TaxID=2567896 RepID=UPI0010ADAEF9|nr:PEGA domain-containing protein [Polyangium aurulentum]UQA56130.1 PEGA domain-containing protein [Polyangium aurulentum]
MKTRACVTALFLSLTAPALLATPLAHAQGADPVTEVARQRYEDGVKAFDAGRFEDARTAFLQAYALKRHPAVLLNLGQSELRSNHPEDAGMHLQQFLREMPSASPEQKAAAEKGIADAKKKTGFVVVLVDANGADVQIDGASVGKSPLLNVVFVKPGPHVVTATYGGKTATTKVDAKQGTATAANLVIGVPGSATPQPQPQPPQPVAQKPPAQNPAPSTTPTATGAQPQPPAPQPSATTPPPGQTTASTYPPPAESSGISIGTTPETGADQATGTREPFFHWYKRKPIAWVGTGVAGIGLISGITFSSLAAYTSGQADKHAVEIRTFYENPQPGSTISDKERFGGRSPCGPEDNAKLDLPTYSDACNTLREDLSDYDIDVALAATGWTLFGVGVIGTAVYAALDWYPKKNYTGDTTTTSSEPVKPRILAITPSVSPEYQGIGVMGTF